MAGQYNNFSYAAAQRRNGRRKEGFNVSLRRCAAAGEILFSSAERQTRGDHLGKLTY